VKAFLGGHAYIVQLQGAHSDQVPGWEKDKTRTFRRLAARALPGEGYRAASPPSGRPMSKRLDRVLALLGCMVAERCRSQPAPLTSNEFDLQEVSP
jgi:hypothetical protein